MSIPKRLGNTVFDSNDPLDDLRPQKKVLSLPRKEPPAEENTAAPVVTVAQAVPVVEPALVKPSGAGQEEEEKEEVPRAQVAESEGRKPKSKRTPEEQLEEVPLHGKLRFSANVSVSTKQKAENAAYWVPGLTISAITEVALEREIRRLEKEFNDGKPFEKAGKLKYGRPRGEG
jgi:hypothetical protein